MQEKTKLEIYHDISEAFGYYFRYHGVFFVGQPAEKEVGEYREYIIKILADLKISDKVHLWELFNPFKYGFEDFALKHWEIWINILERFKKEPDFDKKTHANFDLAIKQIKALFAFEKVKLVYDDKRKIYHLEDSKLSIF